jgi:NAD(P)-dependent dehydrogenase (short-subunit alcohol dehydrogenase family)
MQDKPRRAVVTGATGGIGEAIATRIAASGMEVVMVGRDAARLQAAVERIRGRVANARLLPELADLSLLSETANLAERLAVAPAPAVVVTNAAVIADPQERTREGLPTVLATNHLSPYLLVRSLIRNTDAARTRFVVVGADPGGLAHVPVNVDDLSAVPARGLARIPSMRSFVYYGRTKNMNAMFVYALARRLAGTDITVNGAHPGVIAGTGLGRQTRGLLRVIDRGFNLVRPGPDTGADTPAWLATSPEVDGITGRFFVRRKAVPTAPHTTDVARCDRLWSESARLTALPVAG